MSKVVTSPVKKWPGTVTLSDPLSFPQALAFEDAIDAVNALEKPSQHRLNYTLLPAVLGCVEKWELEGLGDPPSPFPATPSVASARLITWLIREVTALFQEADEVPNA
jgi:hypothetical protein